ncbi:substrate binding domain-containing protein [Pokkaliibacter sp. MBI-7]|uniref:substrate binding domain-containing protein n=1 Tax=Pokkaliibacter sp. MBI-7 TaxID=3040600 RepID=UPI00244820C4|nr:substrate binding domain-containing protein [Pokkaliibacter sp. MBI-7]MDH2435315.1 substrate binding domain-containing protein [Pokkaliibacter sp. MBI-7]
MDLRLTDTMVDLVEGGFDIAIRNSALKDSALIARKLAPDRRIICASPAYIEQFGLPSTPDELKKHSCIGLAGLETWSFDTADGVKFVKTTGMLRTDNGEAMRDACVAGIGIALNSTWSVYEQLKSGELIPILNEYPIHTQTAIWAVYPSSRLVAHKVRVFIDYFLAQFGPQPYWDQLDSITG